MLLNPLFRRLSRATLTTMSVDLVLRRLPDEGEVCGIHTRIIEDTVDWNPYEQASDVPVYPALGHEETRPDLILILPRNLRSKLEVC
jgi:hypothetical protein